MPKIKALYLKAGVDEEPQVIEIDRDNLEQKYKLLDCDCIDIVGRKIGDKQYFIICDDNGRLKRKPASSFTDYFEVAFVGNLLICGIDMIHGELELGSLSEEDVKKIKRAILTYGYIKASGEKIMARAVVVGYVR